MGTAIGTFAFNHTSDINFRTWGKGVSDLIKAAGAVQEADTGQINWDTVAYSPGSSINGYEVFKLTDSVGDLYIKVGYGGYSQLTYPSLRFYISTMPSDGAMNFTNLAYTRDLGIFCLGAVSSGTLRNVYVCVTGTTFAIQVDSLGFYSIERRRNRVTGLLANSQDFIAHGYVSNSNAYVMNLGPSATGFAQTAYRLIPNLTYGPHKEISFVPWAITTSGTPDKNIYRWYSIFPSAHIVIAGVTYIWSEIANDVVFSCAPVGGISHTYRTTGLRGCANSNDTAYAAAMIWE